MRTNYVVPQLSAVGPDNSERDERRSETMGTDGKCERRGLSLSSFGCNNSCHENESGDSQISLQVLICLILNFSRFPFFSGLRLAEQLGQKEEEAKIRHRLGLSLWAGGNLEEAQHQVGVHVCQNFSQV